MESVKDLFLSLVFGISVNPYSPAPSTNQQCSAENSAGAHNIIGVWRRIQENKRGKSAPPGVHNVLVIAQGREDIALEGDHLDDVDVYYSNLICEEVVSNDSRIVTKKGLYFHDDAKKRIKTNIVALAAEDSSPEEKTWTYSFSGSCNRTLLTLTDSSGNKDIYAYVNSDVPEDACVETALTRN